MGVDDVSLALGRLQADAEESQRQRSRLFDLVKEQGERQAEQGAALQATIGEMTAQIRSLAGTVEILCTAQKETAGTVAQHEKIRQRGVGALMIAGLGGGGAGWGFAELIAHLRKIFH